MQEELSQDNIHRYQVKTKYLHYQKNRFVKDNQAKINNVMKSMDRQKTHHQYTKSNESFTRFLYSQHDLSSDTPDPREKSNAILSENGNISGLDSIRKHLIPSTLNSTIKFVESPRLNYKNTAESIREVQDELYATDQINEAKIIPSEQRYQTKDEKLPLLSHHTKTSNQDNYSNAHNRSVSMQEKHSLADSTQNSDQKSPNKSFGVLRKKVTAMAYLKKVLNDNREKNFRDIFMVYEQDLITNIYKKDLQTIIEITSKLMECCVEMNNIINFANFCKFLGMYTFDINDYNKSAFFFVQLKLIGEISLNLKYKVEALFYLSKIATALSFYEISIKILKKGIQYSWKVDDLEFELELYEQIGINYFYLGNLEQARFYHNKYIKADNEVPESPLRMISIAIIDRIISQKDYPVYREFNKLFMFKLSLPISNKFENQNFEDTNSQYLSQNQCDYMKSITYQNSKADFILNSMLKEKEFIEFELDDPLYGRLQAVQNLQRKQYDQLPTKYKLFYSEQQEIDFSFVEKERIMAGRMIVRTKMPNFVGLYSSEEDSKKKRKKLPFNVSDEPYRYKIPIEKQIQDRLAQKNELAKKMEIINNKVQVLLGGKKSTSRQKVRLSHMTDEKTQKIKNLSIDAKRLQRKYQQFFQNIMK